MLNWTIKGFVNPFPHATLLQQTTFNIFCQKIENLCNWMDNPWLKVENIVTKKRNCSFWAISSFNTMFSKSRLLQRRQKASIWGKGLNFQIIILYYFSSNVYKQNNSKNVISGKCVSSDRSIIIEGKHYLYNRLWTNYFPFFEAKKKTISRNVDSSIFQRKCSILNNTENSLHNEYIFKLSINQLQYIQANIFPFPLNL